ncbi:hypothetical protein [Streptomyces plumbiresistens]|uniref:Uncharacterized protein n=1 Tax=Streptomyces plumbiresistens TaxID=511811 RepID=A0ABP7R0D4_9ACTN
MTEDEFDDLADRADEARNAGDMWTAALLYEQVRDTGLALGWQADSLWALRLAAECWVDASEPDRSIQLLLDALHQPGSGIDGTEQYWLHSLFLDHAMYYDVAVTDFEERIEHLETLALSVWGHEGAKTLTHRGSLLSCRGQWQEALVAAERAWAHRDGPGPGVASNSSLAAEACLHSLKLGRRADAERWKDAICPPDNAWARWELASCQVELALFDNDAAAARAASRRTDALCNAQQPDQFLAATADAIAALLLDPAEGDPASPSHLIRVRLAHEEPRRTPMFWLRFSWYSRLAALELAGVRHAAGMLPVDDSYYRRPQVLPRPEDARLPGEIDQRLAAFEHACDTALKHAQEADTRFGCSWRQEEVAQLRRRGRDIAAVFRG